MSLRFSAPVRQLLAALDTARAATPAAPSLTAYAGVKIHAKDRLVTVTGADGDVQIEALLHLATPAGEGSVLVAPGPLAALLRGVDAAAEVSLHIDGDLHVCVADLRPYRLRTIHATLPEVAAPVADELPVALPGLKAALAAVRHASGRELGGVQLTTDGELLHLRATDTYRLHAASLPAKGLPAFQGVVPVPVLTRLCEIAPTHIALDAHARVLMARSSSVRVTSRLLATPFPSVDRILAVAPPKSVVLDTEALLTALGRLQAVAEAAPVSVVVAGGTALLTASNVDVGTGVEELPAAGHDMEFALARQFLHDAVIATQSAKVEIGFTGANQALVISAAERSDIRCVVMPVRQ
jgi:DNA polymerase-3 subunit beta